METKFTPGPWKFDVDIRGPNGETVASGDWDGGVNASLANMNLIEAAPELYEALVCALMVLDGNGPRRIYDLCVAALAKARGETGSAA